MTFGEVLYTLLKLADLKQVQLAEHLGYDVSYINKWISGQKQPSVRNNRALFQNIAEFFLKYGKDDFKYALQNKDGFPMDLSDAEYIQIITEKLTDAYQEPESKRGKPLSSMGNNCFFGKMSTTFTSSNQQIMQAIQATVESGGAQALEFISIPLLDFCGHGEAKRDWMNKLMILPKQTSIHVRFAADFRQEAYYKPLYRDVLIFLFGLPERVRFDLYQDDRFHGLRQGIYICQNAVCVQFFKNVLFQKDSIIASCDPQLISSCYSAADYWLSQSANLLYRGKFSTLYAQKYFRSFLLGQRFSTLHTVMPMLYMRENLFSSLCQRYHFSEEMIAVYRFYEKTDSRWMFTIFESVIAQFLFDGTLWMMGRTVILTEAERAEWLSDLITHVSKKKLDICILNDINPLLNYSDIKCSLFLNEKITFAIRHHEADINRQIIFANDENIIKCFTALFDDIKELPDQFFVTGKAAEDKLRQCLQMI